MLTHLYLESNTIQAYIVFYFCMINESKKLKLLGLVTKITRVSETELLC